MGQGALFGLASENLSNRLRLLLFKNLLRMDLSYFDMPENNTGKIATRFATDVSNFKSALDYRLGSVFASFSSASLGLIFAFYFGWQLAIVLSIIFPLTALGQYFMNKYFHNRSIKDMKDIENVGKCVIEAIGNIRTVQALTLEKIFYKMFCKSFKQPHQAAFRKALLQALSYGFSCSIIFFLYAFAFRYSIFLVFTNILEPINVMRVLNAISWTVGAGLASKAFYIKGCLKL
uniref:ABC transmembrane type-1 domain-containing protein n=1 Tax=Acrobeloides nanus TaxID=290746 RepID=A0A914D7T1_9BILA